MQKKGIFYMLILILLLSACTSKKEVSQIEKEENVIYQGHNIENNVIESMDNETEKKEEKTISSFEANTLLERMNENELRMSEGHPYVLQREKTVMIDGTWWDIPESYVEHDWGNDVNFTHDNVPIESTPHVCVAGYSFSEDSTWYNGYYIGYLDPILALAVEQYCQEEQLNEIFYFDSETDFVSQIDDWAYTVKAESDNRILYVDIDQINYNVHIYEVQKMSEEPIESEFQDNWLESCIELCLKKYGENKKEIIPVSVEKLQSALMFEAEDEYVFKTDLAKEITPDIANRLYNYLIKTENQDYYVQIDAYSMKILLYDAEHCEVKKYHPYVKGRFYNLVHEVEETSAMVPQIQNDEGFEYKEEWILSGDMAHLTVSENLLFYDDVVKDLYYHPKSFENLLGQVLDYYCDTQNVEDVFNYQGESDIVAAISGHLVTARVGSEEQVVYVDMNRYSGEAHVYAIEETAEEIAEVVLNDLTNQVKDNVIYPYLKYGLKKYCDQSRDGAESEFKLLQILPSTVMFENELHPVMKMDLAKELIPEVESNLFNFYLEGPQGKFYMQIDTYSMKVFIYDEESCKVIDYGEVL